MAATQETTAEAVRLPRSAQQAADKKQEVIEHIHEVDENKFDYIVAPFQDPDVKGRNNQTVSALSANTPGNGYTVVVNKDYYGDGSHALIARPKASGKDEHRERHKQFPKMPKGTLKTTISDENFMIRETTSEIVKPGKGDFGDEERAQKARKAAVEKDPDQIAVLEKMSGKVVGIDEDE